MSILPLADTSFVDATWIMLVKSVLIFIVILTIVPVVLLAERKLLGRFQQRYGPNRVGPYGALQPLADVGKLLSKQSFRPEGAVPFLYEIAPSISIISAIITLAILPFGDVQGDWGLYGIDVPIGILYFFAFGSLSFYGLLLGGWASGSKYSFLGAMRAAAQLISYEVAMGLSLLGVVMMAGSLSLVDIVKAQGEMWYVVPQFVGFLIFLVGGFAETNRPPFDLPEADAELVAGYSTEYGGMRFGSYFFAEYMEVLIVSGKRWALLHELRGEAEPRLAELLDKLAPCDLVIVEGFKRAAHPKVEINRAANGKSFLYPEMADVRGLICDAPPADWSGPLAHPDDVAAATDLLLAAAVPLAEVQAALRADRPIDRASPPQPVG